MRAMISRVEGELVSVGKGRAELRCGPFTYELLVPAADVARLETLVGQAIEFHALHYLETSNQGANYTPRLLGFQSAAARAFFELLTTIKGLGPKRTLRALDLPHQRIAEAIATRDLGLLTTLPEIGRKLAETICAQLSDKVEKFIEPPEVEIVAGAPRGPASVMSDAIAVLAQLGEPRIDARRLIERALAEIGAAATADELVTAAFRLKEP